MAIKDYLFTSESVSEGHPDKVCDQISDAILDAFIANDIKHGIADDSHANTRLGCETLELVRAYYKIRESRVRKRIFEMVKAVGAASHAEVLGGRKGR